MMRKSREIEIAELLLEVRNRSHKSFLRWAINFDIECQLKKTHLMRTEAKIEQVGRKTYYDYRAEGPKYNGKKASSHMFPSMKNWETKKVRFFYKGP